MSKFKPPKSEFSGTKFQLKENHVEIFHFDYPVFCFKHIHPSYSIDKCSEKDKAALLEALYKRSQFRWVDLQLQGRHKLGSEKIPVSSIRAKLPTSITEEITHLLAFRYYDMKPFVGYQYKFIFHVLYIDRDRDLYDHG